MRAGRRFPEILHGRSRGIRSQRRRTTVRQVRRASSHQRQQRIGRVRLQQQIRLQPQAAPLDEQSRCAAPHHCDRRRSLHVAAAAAATALAMAVRNATQRDAPPQPTATEGLGSDAPGRSRARTPRAPACGGAARTALRTSGRTAAAAPAANKHTHTGITPLPSTGPSDRLIDRSVDPQSDRLEALRSPQSYGV